MQNNLEVIFSTNETQQTIQYFLNYMANKPSVPERSFVYTLLFESLY